MAREPDDGEETGAKRVLETGIALVHEGELVLPAAGSEAQAEIVRRRCARRDPISLPVEIEVRGGRADGREQIAPPRLRAAVAAAAGGVSAGPRELVRAGA